MKLPVINQPTYTVELPSIKQEVEYRPYTTGDEKKLIMVSQSEDPKFISKTIKDVLQGCILSPGISISSLKSYDIELLMIRIRSKSSGEIITVNYKDDKMDKAKSIKINLEELEVTFPEDHQYTIEINDTVGLRMKDLSFEKVLSYQIQGNMSQAELAYKTIVDCIDSVYNGDEVGKIGVDIQKEELEKFIENIPGMSNEFFKFLNTMPSIQYHFEIGGDKKVIKGIKNFLG
jgi:hypothetical protein